MAQGFGILANRLCHQVLFFSFLGAHHVIILQVSFAEKKFSTIRHFCLTPDDVMVWGYVRCSPSRTSAAHFLDPRNFSAWTCTEDEVKRWLSGLVHLATSTTRPSPWTNDTPERQVAYWRGAGDPDRCPSQHTQLWILYNQENSTIETLLRYYLGQPMWIDQLFGDLISQFSNHLLA